MRIAILEDDQDQSDLLCAWLQEENHHCAVYDNGSVFLRAFVKDSFDLLLLDWNVPETSGIEVLKHVRAYIDQQIPIIFITQRGQEENIVAALERGADDYMCKPVSQSETIARVNAVARRVGINETDVAETLDFPPYTIHTKKRLLTVDNEHVELTQKEYELAVFLFNNVGKVVSRGHLLEIVWGTSATINTRTIDTHISRLRTKLNFNKDNGWSLSSIYQHGYRLDYDS